MQSLSIVFTGPCRTEVWQEEVPAPAPGPVLLQTEV